jgi:hypothetical protein
MEYTYLLLLEAAAYKVTSPMGMSVQYIYDLEH